ncbi:MAG: DUF1080 domain-containing protein [Planctomycetales bacterium]|nr:DUF1080 domain-containing protein [Planctomycetales bacterium]
MKQFSTIALAAVLVSGVATNMWAKGGKAYTSAAEAGEDFAFQGEYVGEIEKEGQASPWGGNLIALGEGKFRAVGFPGGLPGDGWNGEKIPPAEGTREGNKLVCTNDHVKLVFENGAMTAFNSGGDKIGSMKKVERKSPTLGAKPPAGAVVLYAGPDDAEKWENGRADDDGNLMQGVTSKHKTQSFTAHLEFRLPFMPESQGQARGNSGYYVQGRYEVQMLDSFGLEGLDNECGGIYKASRPKVNMCYPPLSWQTYDVDFTSAEFEGGKKVKNARITVKHNGVVIHENLELPGATPGGKSGETPEPGAVFLQDHGNPVRYRNIWIVEK